MSYLVTEADIERTKTLARRMARRWENGLVCFDEVLGDGLEGLTRAAQKFDESRGKEFWAYATVTVNGYIRNGFRKRFGEKGQKLAMMKAESLNLTDDDETNYRPHDVPVEDIDSGVQLLEKIRQMNLGPVQTRMIIMLAAGYSQSDIARMTGLSDGNVSTTVHRIRNKITREQFAEMIGV